MSLDVIKEFNKRKEKILDLKNYYKECLDKFEEMQRIRKRTIDNVIEPLRLILLPRMSPVECEEILKDAQKSIEIPLIKYGGFLHVFKDFVKILQDSIRLVDGLSTLKWWNKAVECDVELKLQLLGLMSEFSSALEEVAKGFSIARGFKKIKQK